MCLVFEGVIIACQVTIRARSSFGGSWRFGARQECEPYQLRIREFVKQIQEVEELST